MRKPVTTVRFKTITVECDNLGTVIFSLIQKKNGKILMNFIMMKVC